MPDAELVNLIRKLDALKHIERTQARSIVALHFGFTNQGPNQMTQDREADSNGTFISLATVVSTAAEAAVTGTTREGDV